MVRDLMQWIKNILVSPWFLWGLFIVNLCGSIYGFYWYKDQLSSTAWYWYPFVPDSPTASTFFTLFLLLFLVGKRSPFIEAFAAITLFKYGIWAVVMIIGGGLLDHASFTDALSWQHWMLIVSHLGMALQAVLYVPFYTFMGKEILVVGTWTLFNDLFDYLFDIHPWVSPVLETYHFQLGIFTLLLSCISLTLFAIFSYLSSKEST